MMLDFLKILCLIVMPTSLVLIFLNSKAAKKERQIYLDTRSKYTSIMYLQRIINKLESQLKTRAGIEKENIICDIKRLKETIDYLEKN
jgi:Ni/Fe-hydrogenase subunit HybB-like protein